MRRLMMNGVGLLLLAVVMGCGSKPPADENAQNANQPAPGTTTTQNNGGGGKAPSMMDKLVNRSVTIPEGAVLEVRTNQALSSKTSQAGETFSASIEAPVEVNGKVVIPKGAEASGTVVD